MDINNNHHRSDDDNAPTTTTTLSQSPDVLHKRFEVSDHCQRCDLKMDHHSLWIVNCDATKDAHGICLLIEWDECKTLDYERIFEKMQKPAFVFDGIEMLLM
ncbi:UDP-glucose/GDP-mannose dehydrogenase C-terminal [Arabidopsis suecica]|uniref:UDP-glucose/GDP-mannose dehydrogenase C-terminal n=1 Tax=Arabidopsis suecica TaxID=45249 RepID=A0A8T2A008_ARASU|nr:UDP-glucose/GDP-mannose dehydrogenase C-terminal [Arabidopsis suecica]